MFKTFNNLRIKIFVSFFLLSVVALLAAMVVIYIQRTNNMVSKEVTKLNAMRDLKVSQIRYWFENTINCVRLLAISPDIQNLIINRDDSKLTTEHHIQDLIGTYNTFFSIEDCIILYNEAGEELLRNSSNSYSSIALSQNQIKKTIEIGTYYLSELIDNKPNTEVLIQILVPIIKQNRCIGVVAVIYNPKNKLQELLQNNEAMGKTGEFIVFTSQQIPISHYNSEKIHVSFAPLMPVAASNSTHGISAVEFTRDYKSNDVIVSYCPIGYAGWGFLAKQDVEEVTEPIHSLIISLIVIIFIEIVMIFYITMYVSKTITKPIDKIIKWMHDFKPNEFHKLNLVNPTHELKDLIEAFYNISVDVSSQILLQNIKNKILNSLISISNLHDYYQELYQNLSSFLGGSIGTVYTLKEGMYIPVYVHGINPEQLKIFPEHTQFGELGLVIASRSILHLNFSGDEESINLHFNGQISNKNPLEVVGIPLNHEGKIKSILLIGLFRRCDSDKIKTLHDLQFGIDAIFSTLSNKELAEIYFNELQNTNEKLSVQTEILQQQTDKFELQTHELIQQSQELKLQTIELQNQNTEIELQRRKIAEVNKLKSEFLSNMSHDLRTPLNSILALSSVLQDKEKSKLNKEDRDYVKIIERNGKNLLSLINHIMDLSKIEAGKVEIKLTEVSLLPVLRIVCDNMGQLIVSKGLELITNFANQDIRIVSDENLLYRVFQNLLSNAVKFTNRGKITINAIIENDTVVISFTDTGIGIPTTELANIFDEFRQVDGTHTRKYEGSGLGLAIVKKTLKILGGEIHVDSVLGVGSTFSVTLPVKINKPIGKTEKIHWNTLIVLTESAIFYNFVKFQLDKYKLKLVQAQSDIEIYDLLCSIKPVSIIIDLEYHQKHVLEIVKAIKFNLSFKATSLQFAYYDPKTELFLLTNEIEFLPYPVEITDLQFVLRNEIKEKYQILVVNNNESDILFDQGKLPNKYNFFVENNSTKCFQILVENEIDIVFLSYKSDLECIQTILGSFSSRNIVHNPKLGIVSERKLTEKEKHFFDFIVQTVLAKSQPQYLKKPHEIFESLMDMYEVGKIESIEIEKTNPISSTGSSLNLSATKIFKNKILIVEDNIDNMVTIEAILKHKYDIYGVATGEAALEVVKEFVPEIVLLDMSLPGKSGEEVVKELKFDKTNPRVYVIALTAYAMKGDKERFLSAGCDYYLSKPIDPMLLLETIEQFVSNQTKPNDINLE